MCNRNAAMHMLAQALQRDQAPAADENGTVPILMVCGILIFALGALNCMFAQFLRKQPKWKRLFLSAILFSAKSISQSCFWLTEPKFFCIFACSFCVWPPFFGLCFIHFGASEKDLGYLGIWDCSPYLHKHTNEDQLDFGTAV